MSIIVEHEKRRSKILLKAMDIFIKEGYENATYQKIADCCNITRTTLYTYFKNKREIFYYGIKQLLMNVETDIIKVKNNNDISHTEKLIQVMKVIIDHLTENRQLLSVIMNFIYLHSGTSFNPDNRIRRRTVRLRHILSTMLIEGIKAKEFSKSIDLKDANELLFSFLESAVLRLTILERINLDDYKKAVTQAVKNFRDQDFLRH